MARSFLPRTEYLIATVLGVAYVVYVLGVMLLGAQVGAPLGDLGECLLVFCSVVAFVVGLLRDEARRKPNHSKETRA
ncbi:MAG: hypothetical protein AB7P21_18145 [Lautropia sp.]